MDYRHGRTPADRARAIAEDAAALALDARRARDSANLPGGTESVPARCAYWEAAADAAEQAWDQADRAWRAARADAGQFPPMAEGQQVAWLEAERARLYLEYVRCRDHREQALAELRAWE